MSAIELNRRQYLEFEKLGLGAFSPLSGFMNEEEFHGVVKNLRLPDQTPFPLPVILDISEEKAAGLRGKPSVPLLFEGVEVGELSPESFYQCDRPNVAGQIFGTLDKEHPGVAMFMALDKVFVGGPVKLHQRVNLDISEYELTPAETRKIFSDKGWKTVVGFQTRNVPHRAHEYLQRVVLEQYDGLFIQPLVGRKKQGDFTPEAIMGGYRALVDGFYPKNRVVLGTLSTFMRYAGPREAVFHAIIRRNYGCTHFIVGRDHAGVGGYYGQYEAHDLTRKFDGELGITVLRLSGPYHCSICDGIVTDQTCSHGKTNPKAVSEISGTDMRQILTHGAAPKPHLMRPEIVEGTAGAQLFISEDEQ